MERRLIIIGAGVAGLSAGVYAARSGYRVTLLEASPSPGGLCASWRRGGYRFDGSAAGLAGTSPEAPIHRLWEELGVIEGCPLRDPGDFGAILLPDGRTVTIWTDIDRLEAELLGHFPRDARAIASFARALRSCLALDIPFAGEEGAAGFLEGLRGASSALRGLPVLLRQGGTSLRSFVAGLEDPDFVRVAGSLVHFGGLDVPLLSVLLPLAYAHRRMTGIPVGGWLSFARAIERRFLALGGEARYGARVVGLLVEGGRAVGARLADGSALRADLVLSAADGSFTRRVLLGESAAEVERRFPPESLSDQPVQVSLGVAEDWSDRGGPLTLFPRGAPRAAGRPQERLTVHNACADPRAAPPGKSALIAFLDSDWAFWDSLAADPPRLEAEKRRCADLVIAALDAARPGFAGRVEVVDVATPLTRAAWTGNLRGAMQARKPDSGIARSLLRGGPRHDYPALPGFWMAGQWVEPWGGITTAALSGRKAVRAICRSEGRRFAPAADRLVAESPLQ